ncbi:MAG: hypothetical protein N3C60_03660 [Calditerrivibrio sp.]|nr:hypothetical protein [Calditerrivibrio sp.]
MFFGIIDCDYIHFISSYELLDYVFISRLYFLDLAFNYGSKELNGI